MGEDPGEVRWEQGTRCGLCWNNTCPLVKHMMGCRLGHHKHHMRFPQMSWCESFLRNHHLVLAWSHLLHVQGSFNFHPKTAEEWWGAEVPLVGPGCTVYF